MMVMMIARKASLKAAIRDLLILIEPVRAQPRLSPSTAAPEIWPAPLMSLGRLYREQEPHAQLADPGGEADADGGEDVDGVAGLLEVAAESDGRNHAGEAEGQRQAVVHHR